MIEIVKGQTVLDVGENTSIARAEAIKAAQARDAAEAHASTATASYRKVATYAEREAIPLGERSRGMIVYVVEALREFEWRLAGDPSGARRDGPALSSSQWVGLYTAAELKNLSIDFTGQLGQDRIAGLSTSLDNLDLGISQRFSGTIAEREAVPLGKRADGMRFTVTDINPVREFQWVKSGSRHPVTGAIATSDSWVGLYSISELKNLAIDPTGTLPAVNVEALPDALTAIDSIAGIEIADFRAEALSNATNPAVALSWSVKGILPTAQTIGWGGYSVTLDGNARTFSPPDYSTVTGIGTVGNSLSDSTDVTTRYSQLLATSYGVDLVSVARYSSDWRQVYRLGAEPLYLTVSGGVLPAGGTSASITHINGVAPSNDPSVNPASWLNVGDAGVTTGLSMVGWIGDRRVTVSIPNGASTAYSIVQDAGASAVTLDGPALFVPDVSMQFAGRTVIVWLGNNYFFSGVPNEYGDHTNPQMWVDMGKIVRFLQARGCRVLLLPVIPSADWTASGLGTARDAYQAANARTESLYPDLYARNGAGLDLIAYLQTQGNGSANDNADIAAGFIPRSLRVTGDSLHLNATGDARVATFVQAALAAQDAPPPITQSTVFSLTAVGVNPRDGAAVASVPVVARVQGGALSVRTEGYIQATEPATSAPALWFDTSNPNFLTLKIQRGA